MVGNSKVIPRFIKGKNESDLEKKILAYQMARNKQFNFINIYPTTGGVVAWFYEEITFREAVNGNEAR